MIHTIQLGVATEAGPGLLGRATHGKGLRAERADRTLRFADYDGLRLRARRRRRRQPAAARRSTPRSRREHAILGVEGARAYAVTSLDADRALLTETLGFTELAEGEYRLEGDERHFHWGYDTTAECARSRAPAPSTTSRGTRSTPTTSRGSAAWPRPACTSRP